MILILIVFWIICFYDPPDTDTGPPDGDKIRLIGSIESMIISDDKYELTVTDVVTENNEKYCNRLKLFSGKNFDSKREDEPLPDLKIGNTISFYGTVKSFRPPGNPGQFDEQSYYRSMGIDARFFVSDISVIDDNIDLIAMALYDLRGLFRDAFYKLLPQKEAGIITAMVLGEKQGLEEDVKELYQENGIAHILAISGLHISMIGFGIFFFLRKTVVALRPAAVITAMILFLYGQLTGFPLATRRAFVMSLILLIAKFIGERFDRMNALAVAAVIELVMHPESLYQSGFLLSYGTVLGIILFVNEFDTLVIGDKKSIKQIVFDLISGSLGVSLVTLPIMVQIYNEIPVFSVVVNALLLPLMSLLLGMSLLGGAVFSMAIIPARFIFGIVYYILQFYQSVCEVVSSISFSNRIVGNRSLIQVFIYYSVLALAKVTAEQRSSRINTKVTLLVLAINILVFLFPTKNTGLTITNIDVGQGDCACVQTDDGKVILIDGGSSDVKQVAKYRIVPYLKYKGIDTIDYMIITHSDADHVNGFEEMLNKDDHFGIRINNVVMPDISGEDKNYMVFENEAMKAGVDRLIKIRAGDKLQFDDTTIMCLHPSKDYDWEDANDYSTVLEIDYGEFKGLFTGDLGFHGEEKIDGLLEDVDYLKVGHHGSKNSSSGSFLSRIRPEIAVASAGYKNRYHHPAAEAVERLKTSGSTFFCTIDHGAVTTHTDGNTVNVDTFIKTP